MTVICKAAGLLIRTARVSTAARLMFDLPSLMMTISLALAQGRLYIAKPSQ
jgi:hypothetical protein